MVEWELPDVISIGRDTLNGAIDWRTFEAEIKALGLGYLAHRSKGDAVRLYFATARDAAQQTTIRAAVAAHTGVPVARGYRIKCADGKTVEAASFSGGVVTWTEIV